MQKVVAKWELKRKVTFPYNMCFSQSFLVQKVDAKMELKKKVAPNMSDILYVITGCGCGYMAHMDCPKALGDVMEAAIGAVYVDCGMDLTKVYPVRVSH